MPAPDIRLAPLQIAEDTFVIQSTHRQGDAPIAVHMNSMVIRAAEPVIVDTGAPIYAERHLEDLFSLVEPEDVRWVFVSHEDGDHVGNLGAVMDACPNATLVASWFLCDRLGVGGGLRVPPTRWRWIGDGESFDAGDRTLAAIRPPLYDSPTTRGLFDSKTGVYWASDCFASPVLQPSATVEELDPGFWAEGFAMFHEYNSPWVRMLDVPRYQEAVDRIARIGIRSIATCHGPAITESYVDKAMQLLRDMPVAAASVPPQPGQPLLDQIIASVLA